MLLYNNQYFNNHFSIYINLVHWTWSSILYLQYIHITCTSYISCVYKSIYINGCKFFFYFAQKKPIFSILHTHFYKTPTSVYLFYTFFYLNNIILTFLLLFTTTLTPPTLTHTLAHIWSLSLSFSFSLSSFFLFLLLLSSSPFFLLQHLRLSSSFAKERKLFVGKLFSACSSCSFAILVWLFIWVWWFFF